MLLDPECSQISYGYSLPVVDMKHWWMSLTAADQGVWFGSIANLLVVAATGITAWIAYRLGSRDARERHQLRSNTSDIAAGLLFTTIASLIAACEALQNTINEKSLNATEIARRFSVIGSGARRFLDSIDKRLIADFSIENKEMALSLAYVLGRIDHLPDLCEVESQQLQQTGATREGSRQQIFNACYEFCFIAQPFVDFCQRKFRKRLGIGVAIAEKNRDQDEQEAAANKQNRDNF